MDMRVPSKKPGSCSYNRFHRIAAVCAALFAVTGATAKPVMVPKSLPAVVVKSFSPNIIHVGETSLMTIELNNPNSLDMGQVAISDIFPAGMQATQSWLVGSDCSGVLSAFPPPPNATEVWLKNGSIPANGTCRFVIEVTGTISGQLVNETGSVTGVLHDTIPTPSGHGASATLAVLP